MKQEEINAAYTQGREYIENIFRDGPPVEGGYQPFLWGLFDGMAQLIVVCEYEKDFNKAMEWAKKTF